MRFLHTADWHVGKGLAGRSRLDEHTEVLAEIVDVARAREVEAVLVAGDLFDSANPPPDAERVVFSTLLDLAEVAPVVVVSGNHDNDRRLGALTPLFRLARVTVRSTVERDPVELRTHSGETARIACIPWLSQRYIVKAARMISEDADETRGYYEERMQMIVDALTGGFTQDTVNIVVAHVTIAGGETGGGERAAQTIFDYWVNPTIFPSGAHYVALGHLHKPQKMLGACPIHYCGAPLHLDFGDQGERRVLVVEASPKVPAVVTPVELTSGRKLRTISGTLDELRRLSHEPTDDHLRVLVDEPARVGLGDDVRDLFPTAVKVIVQAQDDEGRRREKETANLSPHELFEMYLKERNVSDERLVALFDELYEDLHAADQA